MKYPHQWMIWRPGFLIPVFFLLCSQARAQSPQTDALTAAMGQCCAGRSGKACAGLNPAGLGWTVENSCSLLHYRPFLNSGLDIISLSVQLALNSGGPGFFISSMGVNGMRQTSGWISYGLELYPDLYAGAGIHLRLTSVPEYHILQTDAGYVLGIQFRVSEKLILGASVRQTGLRSKDRTGPGRPGLCLITGFSYSVVHTVLFHAEIQAEAGKAVIWRQGLSIGIPKAIELLLGIHNQPFTFSAGISLEYRDWLISLAAIYCMDRGTSPASTLSYAW